MKAYIFPGQGSQFVSMGSDLYHSNSDAKNLFEKANDILNFDICKIMFDGTIEDLKNTNITQPAIFIHSTIIVKCMSNFKPDMLAGHSLGEFSALVAGGVLSFEDGLKLVKERANAMQKACEETESTMAAIIGLDSQIIEETCRQKKGTVVMANYNSPTQLVISGETNVVKKTCEELSTLGAKKTILLPVGGGFHSPMMESAKKNLKTIIENTHFKNPICPIYQNVTTDGVVSKEKIKNNLIEQLTAPVKWYQTIQKMYQDGATTFIEVGPGNVLMGLNKRINRSLNTEKAIV